MNAILYFDRGRRMVQVPITHVAETVERLLKQNYTVTSAQTLDKFTDRCLLLNYPFRLAPQQI